MDILKELLRNGEITSTADYEVTTVVINCRECGEIQAYPVILGHSGHVVGVVVKTLNYDSYMLIGNQSLTCKHCYTLQRVTALLPPPTVPIIPPF